MLWPLPVSLVSDELIKAFSPLEKKDRLLSSSKSFCIDIFCERFLSFLEAIMHSGHKKKSIGHYHSLKIPEREEEKSKE